MFVSAPNVHIFIAIQYLQKRMGETTGIIVITRTGDF